ncbi:hypothetical protein PoB_007168800 [Plakobranchus ocellatus]|uniref:Uncharacterized protein n=1 Tax=Plakobranchus ocellatus TaxID=259542 RepID=A0AAV4DLL9_9GAST|nr:hypothetical protein PoB_007168800 [Plakobranchus ocellatus]
MASTLQNYSQPSLPTTTTIHPLWPLLCQRKVSLHCLPQPPSMLPGRCSANLYLHSLPQPPYVLPGLYSANLWSAFIACQNNHPCSLASTLATYSQPSMPATTTIRAPSPLLCQLISAFIACHNHHPCTLATTLPTYSQPSLPATTTIHAPWPLLCQHIVSLHCLPQPPSVRPGLYFANLKSAFIACHNHLTCSLASSLPTYGQPSLPAKPTIRAPWTLHCQLIVSLHCLQQPPSILRGLYSEHL